MKEIEKNVSRKERSIGVNIILVMLLYVPPVLIGGCSYKRGHEQYAQITL